MSLRDRLVRAAREGLNDVQERIVRFERDGGVDALLREAERRVREQEQRWATGQHPLNPAYRAQIGLWYARLELPYGANADEVRKAYRGLMRKYHPDRFARDPEGEALATRLSQELTVAYEGLLQHLGA